MSQPGLDLELDAHVALVEVAADGVEQLRDRVHDPDRDATRHGVVHRAELARERAPLGAQLGVEHGHLEGGLGHAVALERLQRLADGRRVADACRRERGDEEPLHDIDGAVGVLGRVHRVGERDALAPALRAVGHGLHEQDVARGLRAERRAERRHQRHRDPPQLESLDLHGCVLLSEPDDVARRCGRTRRPGRRRRAGR